MVFFSSSRSKSTGTISYRVPRSYHYGSKESLGRTTSTMSTSSGSTSGSRPTSRQHDTGFPDSFAARTTSLRHPDAIVDPGFVISSEHVDPAKSLLRSRHTLLCKHRRTISNGTTSLCQDEETDRSLAVGDGTNDLAAATAGEKAPDPSTAEAIASTSSGAGASNVTGADESESILGVLPGFQYTMGEEQRRTKIFRKFRHGN